MSQQPHAGNADDSATDGFTSAIDPFATFEVPTNGVVLQLSDVHLQDSAVEVQASPSAEISDSTPSVQADDSVAPAEQIENQHTVAAEQLQTAEGLPESCSTENTPKIPTSSAVESVDQSSAPVVDPVLIPPPPAISSDTAAPVTVKPMQTTQQPELKAKPEASDAVSDSAIVKEAQLIQHRATETDDSENHTSQSQIRSAAKTVSETPSVAQIVSDTTVNSAATVSSAASPRSSSASSQAATMFSDLGLRPEVHTAIQRHGYTTPTEIQAQIIPYMLDGRDVLAQSQTGTGKTAAFALPILSRIDLQSRHPQILVLAPTRELAIQVGRSFETYGEELSQLKVATIYGGSDYYPQLKALKQGVQVVVGTPGRTIDHINRGTLKLNGITCLALDEADEMLNMGFLDDVQQILEHTPDDRQIALFSATMPGPIREIAQQYLNNPVRITVKAKTMTADSIRQRAVITHAKGKVDALLRFLEYEDSDGAIVFTKTRESTVSVADTLIQNGLKAVALNGDMPQKVRERTIDQLKKGRLDVLVATDVAARGLDVSRISHVFNFDVPQDNESYIHRIGRTGRAGRKGEAIIFLSKSQRYKLRQIERATRQPIEVVDPPSADQLNGQRVEKFKQKITAVINEADLAFFRKLITEHAAESGVPMEDIAAALAQISQDGRPFFVEDRPRRSFEQDRYVDDHSRNRERGRDRDRRGGTRDRGGRDGREERRPRRLGTPEPGMERFRIEVGRRDGVKPGNIVGAVANEGGLDGNQIGPISIHDSHSTVDLPEGLSSDVFQTLRQVKVAGKPLKLRRSQDSTDFNDAADNRRPGKRFGNKRFGGKPKSSSNSRFGNKGKFRKRKPKHDS